MTPKRIGILAGGVLVGALLLGTAGLALAQDPTRSPGPGPSRAGMMSGTGPSGLGMMSGTDPSSGAGMMGGVSPSGTAGMSGGSGAGMMTGTGMMGGTAGRPSLTPDQVKQMQALHDQMVASGTCDPAQMQQFHR